MFEHLFTDEKPRVYEARETDEADEVGGMSELSGMTASDRVDMVWEAERLVEKALGLLKKAVDGTGVEPCVELCGHCGLDQALGNDNRYEESLDSVAMAIRLAR